MKKMYDAVILAGGYAPWLQEVAGTDIRCLAKLNGKRILDYLTEALKSSGRVKRIMLAAPAGAISLEELPEGVELCEAEKDMPTTAQKAADALESMEKLLFVCDDIPMLHAAAVTDFLDKCEAYPDKQVYYPIIPKNVCERDYPKAQRTYVKLADGVFTGGNMMIVDAAIIPQGLAKAREIFARRKQPFQLCKWLGFGFILKFLLHRLTLLGAEQRTAELLELPCKVVVSNYAEVGMDIDKPADWQLIDGYLAAGSK